MNSFFKLAFAAAALATSGAALAFPNNIGPPPGALVSLAGLPLYNSWFYTSRIFEATGNQTTITFALRSDRSAVYLDNVILNSADGINLLANGSFEGAFGPDGQPEGWSYANPDSVQAGGTVFNAPGFAFDGENGYGDGAVQAYDFLSQTVATTIGTLYQIGFQARAGGNPDDFYRAVSTTGFPGLGGNGTNIALYVDSFGTDPVTGGVPEPASWAMLITGFGLTGAAMRRRRPAIA